MLFSLLTLDSIDEVCYAFFLIDLRLYLREAFGEWKEDEIVLMLNERPLKSPPFIIKGRNKIYKKWDWRVRCVQLRKW
jgi:hypothetical protein